jgi:MSHA biogenesis protein MshK
MVERVSAARVLCVLAAAATSAAATAQARLADPTRPPQGAEAPEAPAGAAVQPAPKEAHRLQSVLIAPDRKLAVIDGRTVPLGGRIDGAHVVAITETSVTLRRGAQTETLPLNAGVQKKQVVP